MLNLMGNRIGSDSIKLLGKTFNQLSCLILSDCSLGVSGMQALEEAVCTVSLCGLEWLSLAGSLTSDTDINSALLATSLDAIMYHSHHLSFLGLSRNNLGVPGASALARVLCKRNSIALQSNLLSDPNLISIHLDETNLGDNGLVAFVDCLSHIDVSDLLLNGNVIHATGISYLADGVHTGKIVLKGILSLDDNPLGLEGAASIGRMLSSSYCQLRRLSLRRCQLTTPASRFLDTNHDSDIDNATVGIIGKQLCQNNTTRFLDLNGNSFTGESVHILAKFMYLCPNLQALQSSNCGITSDDLKQLLDQLTTFKNPSIASTYNIPYCNKLECWDLSNNQIDDNGAIALIDDLPSLFPKLSDSLISSGVVYCGNHISSEVMRRIMEKIERRNEESRIKYEEIKELQRDWMEIVDTLCALANDILYHPYRPYQMVVVEKERDKSGFSGSSEKENPIHMYMEGEQDGSSSSAPPTIRESMVVKQECLEHSSDDDTETFHTPPSSPTPTDEHDRALPVTAEDDIENLLQSQIHFPVPELKDLDLIKLVNWQGVGLQLGIEDYELQTIELNYQKHCDQKREMFRVWLRICANPNYHDLTKALEAVGERKVAQQIREKFL